MNDRLVLRTFFMEIEVNYIICLLKRKKVNKKNGLLLKVYDIVFMHLFQWSARSKNLIYENWGTFSHMSIKKNQECPKNGTWINNKTSLKRFDSLL